MKIPSFRGGGGRRMTPEEIAEARRRQEQARRRDDLRRQMMADLETHTTERHQVRTFDEGIFVGTDWVDAVTRPTAESAMRLTLKGRRADAQHVLPDVLRPRYEHRENRVYMQSGLSLVHDTAAESVTVRDHQGGTPSVVSTLQSTSVLAPDERHNLVIIDKSYRMIQEVAADGTVYVADRAHAVEESWLARMRSPMPDDLKGTTFERFTEFTDDLPAHCRYFRSNTYVVRPDGSVTGYHFSHRKTGKKTASFADETVVEVTRVAATLQDDGTIRVGDQVITPLIPPQWFLPKDGQPRPPSIDHELEVARSRTGDGGLLADFTPDDHSIQVDGGSLSIAGLTLPLNL